MEKQKAQVRVPATVPEKLKWLDALLAEEVLSMTAKVVATRLLRHHNDESGKCDPQQDTMAADIGRSVRSVNSAISELRKAGWIEVYPRQKRADYVLVIARAEAASAGKVRRNSRARSAESGVAGTQKAAHQVRKKLRTEPPTLTTKGTTQPTTVPAAVASKPEMVGPAELTPMPDQPVAKLPVPANDDTVGAGGETFSGFFVPDEVMRQWLAAFPDSNVRGTVMRKAPWLMSSVPANRRIKAMTTLLDKLDKVPRQARIGRKESKAADVEAGIVGRDLYGRPIRKPEMGWIERPRAAPPGADRYWMPPNYGDEIVFRAEGWSLTKKKLDEGMGRWPDIDFKAAVTEFDANHASAGVSETENRNKLAAFLDARQAEAMAA